MTTENESWPLDAHPTEYRCPRCGGVAIGHASGAWAIRGEPIEIRKNAESGPFRVQIKEWADGQGCTLEAFGDETQGLSKVSNQHIWPRPLVLMCSGCHRRSRLEDPYSREALYWRIPTRHGVLWALNRPDLAKIRDYIAATVRPQTRMYKLPGKMIQAKYRDEIIRLINRALERGPGSR